MTTAYTSGQAAFVAKLAGNLVADATERLTYYGGGDRTRLGGDRRRRPGLPGRPDRGDAASRPDHGVRRLCGRHRPDHGRGVAGASSSAGRTRNAAPTAIAVDAGGASVLDRLGLPKGAIDWTGSQQVVANSSVRAGDQFYVRSGSGSAKAITIEESDTLKTLADKVSRALGFTAKVEVVIDAGLRPAADHAPIRKFADRDRGGEERPKRPDRARLARRDRDARHRGAAQREEDLRPAAAFDPEPRHRRQGQAGPGPAVRARFPQCARSTARRPPRPKRPRARRVRCRPTSRARSPTIRRR